MPKMKTSRAAAKRFKKTGTGQLKRNKAIAQEADAVVRVNGRKLNSMEKIRQYIDTVAGK